MSLFKSSNPTLSDKAFEKTIQAGTSSVMTVKGTIGKTFLLLLLALAAAAYTWKMFYTATAPSSVMPWMWGGLIGAFVMALIVVFKPASSPYTAPIYAALEGLFLGGISAMFEAMYRDVFPGIVLTAVLATLLTMFVMLAIYRSGIIKVNQTFRMVIIGATASIALLYLVHIVMRLVFNSAIPVLDIANTGWWAIGLNAVIIVIAALNLVLDFDFIERGSQMGAPKYMEWYGAFGLMVTLVWIYLEILKLLGRLARR